MTLETVQSERRSMPPSEFGRERLGWWDEDPSAVGVFPRDAWAACVDAESQIAELPTYGVDVSQDRSAATISACGAREDGLLHIETVLNRPGTDWVLTDLPRITAEHGGFVVIDPGSPAGSLIDDLHKAGVVVRKMTARDYAQSCGWLFDAVKEQQVRRLPEAELESAARGATTRDLAGGYAWDRKNAETDITPLVAATLACWGHRTFGDILKAVW